MDYKTPTDRHRTTPGKRTPGKRKLRNSTGLPQMAMTTVQAIAATLTQYPPEQAVQQALALCGEYLPSRVDDETFQAILDDVAAGEFGYKACNAHGIPHGTFWRILANDPARMETYTRARDHLLDRIADQIIELSDICRDGVRTKTYPDGTVERITGDMIERAKLQVDSRKWLLSKLAPKKYGDKLELSGDANNPIAITISPADDKL
jgi:hypothetical protein